MGFGWGTRGGLAPMRMIWFDRDHEYPRYELARWRNRRGVQALVRLNSWCPPYPSKSWCPPYSSKVEEDRETRRRFPGKLGDWPLYDRHGKHKRKPKPKIMNGRGRRS